MVNLCGAVCCHSRSAMGTRGASSALLWGRLREPSWGCCGVPRASWMHHPKQWGLHSPWWNTEIKTTSSSILSTQPTSSSGLWDKLRFHLLLPLGGAESHCWGYSGLEGTKMGHRQSQNMTSRLNCKHTDCTKSNRSFVWKEMAQLRLPIIAIYKHRWRKYYNEWKKPNFSIATLCWWHLLYCNSINERITAYLKDFVQP